MTPACETATNTMLALAFVMIGIAGCGYMVAPLQEPPRINVKRQIVWTVSAIGAEPMLETCYSGPTWRRCEYR